MKREILLTYDLLRRKSQEVFDEYYQSWRDGHPQKDLLKVWKYLSKEVDRTNPNLNKVSGKIHGEVKWI